MPAAAIPPPMAVETLKNSLRDRLLMMYTTFLL
jgi:hypothetical protein